MPTAEGRVSTDSLGGRVFVNQDGSPDVGREIRRLISEASRSIDIVNPLVTDPRVVDALTKARARGVRVRIITELRDNRGAGIRYPTRGFETADTHSLKKDQFEAIRELATHRVFCRGLRYYAHAKLLLTDESHLLLSSVNLTPNSMGEGAHPSLEAGVQIDDSEVVSSWTAAMVSLWDACPLRLHLMGTDVSLQQEPVTPFVGSQVELERTRPHCMAWSFPPMVFQLRDLLVELCETARERIVFSALTFFLEHEKAHLQVSALRQAIVEALQRGVRVTVVVRPEHFPLSEYPNRGTLDLIACGLRLHGMKGLHAKGVLVDTSACAILSGNINPYSLECGADSAHVECGYCERGELNVMAGYAVFLAWLAANPSHVYQP